MEDGLSYDNARYYQERQITFKLRTSMTDSGGKKNSVTDQVATCPVMASVVPDTHWAAFKARTGRGVYPTHYVINNYGGDYNPETGSSFGPTGGNRWTSPAQYFGYSPAPGTQNYPAQVTMMAKLPPQPLSKIKKASEEWMIAEAWYRPANFPLGFELQQEGPYQVSWTGEALPNFAPHFSAYKSYSFDTSATRQAESSRIRSARADGRTNTVFFDGHAGPVISRKYTINNQVALYGYPGTKNPARVSPPDVPPPGMDAWDGVWE